MRFLNYISVLILFGIMLCSQVSTGQDVPEIMVEEFPDLSIGRNDLFDGKSLWGYMNGGADIYLEYGFQALRVEAFSSGDETIKLELYKMDDPLSAYGIYSFKTFKCQKTDVMASPDCLNKYQYQLVYGDYYIQLINESGSEKAKTLMTDIAAALLQKLEPKALNLPAVYLQDSLAISHHDIKMIKGPLGLMNKAMFLADCLNDIESYQIYYAKRVEDGEWSKYYEVIFDTPEMKNLFLENNKNKKLQVINTSPRSLVIQPKSLND